MLSILIGLFAIVGGVTGTYVLRGTNSSGALIVGGLVMIGRGLFQLTRRNPNAALSAPAKREETEYDREIQAAYERAKGRKVDP